jgi:hypothetical protein
MDGTYSTHGVNKKCKKKEGKLERRDHLKGLCVDGRIILK